jgi:hypothetical protein
MGPGGPTPPEENPDLADALRSLHFDRYLAGPSLVSDRTQVGGWDVFHYRTEDLRCVLGGEYFIMARRGTVADSTVVWLEGGGACWPGRDDCATEAQFNPWIEEGGLASPDQNNPVRSWNFIYVPYCDGSIHLGDADADYDGDGVVDHWHWGLRTTAAAARLAVDLFPGSRRFLIAGCSAGGAGTIAAVPVVRLLFPDASLYVLNISGLGLVDPSEPELPGLLAETWNIDDFVPADCPRCRERLTFMYSWLLERDSRLRVGVYSSLQDRVVSSGWGEAPEVYQSLLLDTTEAIRAEHPDTFRRYFIAGDAHCAGDYSYRLEGVSLWDWIRYLVGDDPRWTDLVEGWASAAE